MIRSYLLPLSLLAVMLVFAVWNGISVSNDTAQWQAELRIAAALAAEEDWPAASATLEDSYAAWTARQTWLHIVIRHDAINNAEAMYRRAMAFADTEEPSEFQAEIADLIAQLRLVAEMERFHLKNIL